MFQTFLGNQNPWCGFVACTVHGFRLHSADVTGITNITAGNLIVWTFMSNENEANSRIIFTKWLREDLLNSLHCIN